MRLRNKYELFWFESGHVSTHGDERGGIGGRGNGDEQSVGDQLREHVQRDVQQRHGGNANSYGEQQLDFFGLDGRRLHRDEHVRDHDERGYQRYGEFFSGNADD